MYSVTETVNWSATDLVRDQEKVEEEVESEAGRRKTIMSTKKT